MTLRVGSTNPHGSSHALRPVRPTGSRWVPQTAVTTFSTAWSSSTAPVRPQTIGKMASGGTSSMAMAESSSKGWICAISEQTTGAGDARTSAVAVD